MEFNEKLQKLRKSRGLTQEELAEALFVSRTAVSKWESGRGYPNIDSLKEISKFFSVTIDDLLSGDELICIAEKENKSNIKNLCDLLFGTADLFSFMLIILPLYPNKIDGYIYSVNLIEYVQASSLKLNACWAAFIALFAVGIIKIILTKLKSEKGNEISTAVSLILNVLAVLFLAVTREAYAAVAAFLILTAKAIIFFKHEKTK